jgi:hypothetical protein
MLFEDGRRYEGEWQKGLPEGQGRAYSPTAPVMKGDGKGGVMHGQGTITYPNNRSYTGNWVNGEWQGEGSYRYADGSRYYGGWMRNMRHGNGTLVGADGSRYTGEWRNDKRHGYGTLTLPDGLTYSGECMTTAGTDSERAFCRRREVSRQLEGRQAPWKRHLPLPDGNKYSGNWEEDREHGEGTLILYPLGIEYRVRMEHGTLIQMRRKY